MGSVSGTIYNDTNTPQRIHTFQGSDYVRLYSYDKFTLQPGGSKQVYAAAGTGGLWVSTNTGTEGKDIFVEDGSTLKVSKLREDGHGNAALNMFATVSFSVIERARAPFEHINWLDTPMLPNSPWEEDVWMYHVTSPDVVLEILKPDGGWKVNQTLPGELGYGVYFCLRPMDCMRKGSYTKWDAVILQVTIPKGVWFHAATRGCPDNTLDEDVYIHCAPTKYGPEYCVKERNINSHIENTRLHMGNPTATTWIRDYLWILDGSTEEIPESWFGLG